MLIADRERGDALTEQVCANRALEMLRAATPEFTIAGCWEIDVSDALAGKADVEEAVGAGKGREAMKHAADALPALTSALRHDRDFDACRRGLEEIRGLLGKLLVMTTASGANAGEERKIDTGESDRKLTWVYAPKEEAKPYYDEFIQAGLEYDRLNRRLIEGRRDSLADAVARLRSIAVRLRHEADNSLRQ